MGKPVKFIKDYVSPFLKVNSGTIGTVVDYPGKDQGAAADQPDQEFGTLKIDALDATQNKIVRVGLPIDQLAAYIQDVPIGTAPSPTT